MIQNDKENRQNFNDLSQRNSKIYLLVTLSAMTAFAPLVTDMYMSALPSLSGYFKTSVLMVQITISTSMLGIALGKLFFGSVSDKSGRRRRPLSSVFIF
jgi:DHA1 family bicyclomycin/chloramphenicol resistance-like MFS transporter